MSIDVDIPVAGGASREARIRRKQRNPSLRHQALLELMKLFPETPIRLVLPRLRLGYRVAGLLEARPADTDALGLRIDNRLDYFAAGCGDPVLTLVIEVQMDKEDDLRWRLCPYLGYASYEGRCAAAVLVICGTRALARKLARPVELGTEGNIVTAVTAGPDDIPVITNAGLGIADPGLLLLSAWFHTRSGPRYRDLLVRLIAEVIALINEVDPEKAQRYHELAQAILPVSSTRRLKQMTQLDIADYVYKKYYPELFTPIKREARKQGRAEGLAEGRAKGRAEGRAKGRAEGLLQARAQDVLRILRRRGIRVPADIRKTILACRDSAKLSTWIDRAVTADAASDVIVGEGPIAD
jgi:hypothetical protein